MEQHLIHATCVAIDGAGVLLLGAPASGKSDLALRLMDGGAQLVADDQVSLVRDGTDLVASAPRNIVGRLEVRGVGIIPIDALPLATLGLAIELTEPETLDRLPEKTIWEALGVSIPLVRLAPFEASAAAKARLIVQGLARNHRAETFPASDTTVR